MLKLKENVTGFIYDSCYGHVTKIYTEPLSEEKIEIIDEVLDEDDVLFTDNESINDMFEISNKEDLENCEDGLSEVLEWI